MSVDKKSNIYEQFSLKGKTVLIHGGRLRVL
jgi:hypothetical protein